MSIALLTSEMRGVVAAFVLASLTVTATHIAAESDDLNSGKNIVSRIRRQPINSSAVAAIGYSKRLHALEIEFRNGAIYRYLDVPAEKYRQLLAADSKAQFYDLNIRGCYYSVHVRAPESE